MKFIGVQHDQLPRLRVSFTSAIVKALHALERDADHIGIVTVRCKGEARKAGFDTLYIARRPNNPIFFMTHGQIQITPPNVQFARGI